LKFLLFQSFENHGEGSNSWLRRTSSVVAWTAAILVDNICWFNLKFLAQLTICFCDCCVSLEFKFKRKLQMPGVYLQMPVLNINWEKGQVEISVFTYKQIHMIVATHTIVVIHIFLSTLSSRHCCFYETIFLFNYRIIIIKKTRCKYYNKNTIILFENILKIK